VTTRKPVRQFVVYQQPDSLWRWAYLRHNKVIFRSETAYTKKDTARRVAVVHRDEMLGAHNIPITFGDAP